MSTQNETIESQRLAENGKAWRRWGPYVSDRAWGTVREDYSASGDAWSYFPHDHARSRTYRWNEDGLAGFCNDFQNVCLAVALWNEKDSILKERLFGVNGHEGNHAEDVKEYYYHLDGVPSHAYMKMLYRYPQVAYPYTDLVDTNRRRGREEPEYELVDAIRRPLEEKRFFDVIVEYAKADTDDILCRITAINQGPEPAPLHILPHLWFRNDWSWGYGRPKPQLRAVGDTHVEVENRFLGTRHFYIDSDGETPLLFTENETNHRRLSGTENSSAYVKDGINDVVVDGTADAVNPDRVGTKMAAHFHGAIPPGEEMVVRVRLTPATLDDPFAHFDAVFEQRLAETDAFYDAVHPAGLNEDERRIQRQAFAGLLWTKQLYNYGVELWLKGDPAQPAPPESRKEGRNQHWIHLDNIDVISMPDKWEYPWYASWDLAFHMIPFAMIDSDFAKHQLLLFLREWYMHPNGQIPAYEWAFEDVNPPVHAWACWRVYKIDRNIKGKADVAFLERTFHKLLLNFTWWVNRKDTEGNNIFEGGFLGLDNIGVFDRSRPLPTGGHIEQADGTAWMAMYCLNMLAIALELARHNPVYEDTATKFFEHFIYIANAIDGPNGLWDPDDGFYYDKLHLPDGSYFPLKIHSLVGLIPLYAVETMEPDLLDALPDFQERMKWFFEHRPNFVERIASLTTPGEGERRLLSLVDETQLRQVLARMLDKAGFLSPFGLRGLSKRHAAEPYTLTVNGEQHVVAYEPAESTSGLFGGNSNWRGPIWFPVNYLMIESLQKYYHYYGDAFTVEYPTGSGRQLTLNQIANALAARLIATFVRDEEGNRPVFGSDPLFQQDPLWRDYLLFYEYFHGDNGTGLGASHQTGWTALVAKLLTQCA